MSKGLGDFEDLKNVSEMVAETLEMSKDHPSESATIKTTRAGARELPVKTTCTSARAEFAIRDKCRKSDFSA